MYIYIDIYIIFIILGYRYQWLPYSSMHFHIGFMCFMFTQFVSFFCMPTQFEPLLQTLFVHPRHPKSGDLWAL